MEDLLLHSDSPGLYSKNPNTSELGRRIVSTSIEMISEIGIEAFTFKKLGLKLDSPESSIYRYFKNKHILLVYLTNWYWTWTEYRLVFAIANIESPQVRLTKAIELLTKPVLVDHQFTYINEVLLSKVVFSESIKTYHTQDVDKDNEKGCFRAYKKVVKRVSDIIYEINPKFKYSHMLVSTILEGAQQQRYFAEHLPSLTDVKNNEDSVSEFYKQLTFNFLNNE